MKKILHEPKEGKKWDLKHSWNILTNSRSLAGS